MSTLQPEQDERSIASAVESILLVFGDAVSLRHLAAATGASRREIIQALEEVRRRQSGGIRLQVLNGHAQLVSAAENADVVQRFLGTAKPPPLSRPALEALAVIAYQQPVTRAEIEAARGVNSDRVVATLEARGLIEECGRRDAVGRPVEYRTTFGFLEYFGLSGLAELPEVEVDGTERLEPSVMGMRASANAGEE